MRQVEYIYLAAALMILGFLAMNARHMSMLQVLLTCLGAMIAAFMFSFRRAQRQAFEKREMEELEEMKRKAGDHD